MHQLAIAYSIQYQIGMCGLYGWSICLQYDQHIWKSHYTAICLLYSIHTAAIWFSHMPAI